MALLFGCWCWDATALLAALCGSVYLYYMWTYSYWRKRGVPYMPPKFPFGNIADILLLRRIVGEVYGDVYRYHTNEKLCGMFIVLQPALVLRDPETIKNFLVKDFVHFHDRGIYFNEKIDPLSAHLFLLNGLPWKNLRQKLTPTFTSGKMKMMFQVLFDCGLELRNHMEEPAILQEIVEVKDILARFTTDVIASCAFGINCNCLKDPDAKFRYYGRKFLDPPLINIFGALLNFMMPNLAKILKIRSIDPKLATFLESIVKETVEYRETNNVSRNDFMQLLIQLKNKGYVDGDANDSSTKAGIHKMTINEIAAQVFLFFLAGFETSSTTMSFALYELACNPEIQARLQREMDLVLAKHNGEITYESLQEMEYLDQVIAETLRKYPPVSILNRTCTIRYLVPDTDIVLEQGTNVIVPVQAIHHDPQYYPDPMRFDPERFREEEKAKRHHYVYLPFGEGPRICIGMRFGLMQTKVGLTSLLTKFTFKKCNKTPVPLVYDPKSFILAHVGGMYLQVLKRTNN